LFVKSGPHQVRSTFFHLRSIQEETPNNYTSLPTMKIAFKPLVIYYLIVLCLPPLVNSFKTGLEDGLICIQCVGTHPGCSLYDMDYRWYWGRICPRKDDRCVKLIERKGAEVMVTRDCLSNLEAHRTDIPADKYEGCYPGTHDVKLGQYVFNRIKELDVYRTYYDNTTWCFCQFDHWCNHAPKQETTTIITSILTLTATAAFMPTKIFT